MKKTLDNTLESLKNGNEEISTSLMPLISELSSLRWETDKESWANIVTDCRSHPVFDLLYEEPFCKRASEKPRGYSGDAELLDIIYDSNYLPYVTDVTPFGAELFPFIINREMPSAVRERRDILTSKLDEICVEFEKPHILSVACGHLREAEKSEAFLAGEIERFVALDQDGESLDVVEHELSKYRVETVKTSIKTLMSSNDLGKFDFIYAAGLYDYLPDGFAHLFTKKLFNMLNPNGRLLVANYLTGIEDAGFIEIFMDWFLIYRTPDDVRNLLSNIPPDEISSQKFFSEKYNNIGFLEIRKH